MVVIDDHDLVGSSLLLMLQHQGFDARRISVQPPEGLLEEVGAGADGVALVDLDIRDIPDRPLLSGVDLVAALRCRGWHPVVMSSDRHEEVAASVAAGAVGVALKSSPADDLLVTMRAVLDHGRAMGPAELEQYIARADRTATRRRASTVRLHQLSRRELQVLERLADGQRAAAIAQEFVTSISTVRTQIRSILSKLGVGSQLEAVALLHTANGSSPR